jgi:hypothetical protein
MNNFPIKMKTSPNPITNPKLQGLVVIKKNASFADPQKLFPVIAI